MSEVSNKDTRDCSEIEMRPSIGSFAVFYLQKMVTFATVHESNACPNDALSYFIVTELSHWRLIRSIRAARPG